MSDTLRDQEIDADLKKTFTYLAGAFGLGWITVLVRNFMFAFGGDLSFGIVLSELGKTSSSFLWTLAWLAAGFLFGFLFGVPKAVAKAATVTGTAVVTPQDNMPVRRLRVNTNLEEISDWLTKVLVGATLTQIMKIPHTIYRAASFMALGDAAPGSIGFNAAILIYFVALGFLSGYITTRMFFQRAFERAD